MISAASVFKGLGYPRIQVCPVSAPLSSYQVSYSIRTGSATAITMALAQSISLLMVKQSSHDKEKPIVGK